MTAAIDSISIIDDLLSNLAHQATSSQDDLAEYLKSVSGELLTLHAILPGVLLPALDLLDRHAVIRLVLQNETLQATRPPDSKQDQYVYLVESNVSSASTYTAKDRFHRTAAGPRPQACHEVRLQAWACSCAAFAFAAFSHPGDDERRGQPSWSRDSIDVASPIEANEESGARWGGAMRLMTTRTADLPVCKHLLACLLSEHWLPASKLIEERTVSKEELAGWTGGWAGT